MSPDLEELQTAIDQRTARVGLIEFLCLSDGSPVYDCVHAPVCTPPPDWLVTGAVIGYGVERFNVTVIAVSDELCLVQSTADTSAPRYTIDTADVVAHWKHVPQESK